MAVSLLATRTELDSISTINHARQWIGLDDDAWAALDASLGQCPNLRVLALIPAITLQRSIESTRVFSADSSSGPRPLTVVEGTQARLMWRVARQKFNLADEDPLDAVAEDEPEPPIPTSQPEPPRPPASKPLQIPGPLRDFPKPDELYGKVVTTPMKEGKYTPMQDPSVTRVQQITKENFYNIHRTRGLHLGPRFRAVSMAVACPNSCLAVLDPRRPKRKAKQPEILSQKGDDSDRWWRQYLPGAEPPQIPKPRELPTYAPGGIIQGRAAGGKRFDLPQQTWWPAREGRGLGILKEVHEPILWQAPGEAPRLVMPDNVVQGAEVYVPPKSRNVTGTFHPATLEDDDDDECDEPWSYLPGLYDAILTCTFLAAPPVPGVGPSQLPLPFRVDTIRVRPHVKSTASYFGRCHPTDEAGATHYFEITSPNEIVMHFGGFEARAARAPAETKATAQLQGGEKSAGDVYIYKTRATSPGRAMPTPPSTRPSRTSRTYLYKRPTVQKTKTGTSTLSQAEKDEVRKRVAKWSSFVPDPEEP